MHCSLKGASVFMSKNRIVVLAISAVAAALLLALPAGAKQQATTVTVTEGVPEFGINLSAKSVKAGVVTFKVTNKGNLPHDFKIGTKRTPMLSPGKSATVTVTLKKGKIAYLCTVSGHAAAGMKGTLTVL
jgi:nitrite reductase (NO-forming)